MLGSSGVPAEARPLPSPSDASTVHEETGSFVEAPDPGSAEALSQQEDVNAWDGAENDAGGDCDRSSTEEEGEEEEEEEEGEEGMMDSGSTVKEVCARAGSNTGCGVQSDRGIGISGDEDKLAAAGVAKEGGDDDDSNSKTSRRAPDERATKRRRLCRAGCGADDLLREPQSQGTVRAAVALTPEGGQLLLIRGPPCFCKIVPEKLLVLSCVFSRLPFL